MAGILTFKDYVGGPDEVIIEQAFPNSQKSVLYNFNEDITDYTFEADYQTLIVDKIKFNRYTGAPNFSDSTVIGYFPKVDIQSTDPFAPNVINAADGVVQVTFPANMYTGPIIPDARENVAIVVFSVTWTIASNIDQIITHRWAFLQAWEPDIPIGDPTEEADFTGLTI
jgi:hypothetical protein